MAAAQAGPGRIGVQGEPSAVGMAPTDPEAEHSGWKDPRDPGHLADDRNMGFGVCVQLDEYFVLPAPQFLYL